MARHTRTRILAPAGLLVATVAAAAIASAIFGTGSAAPTAAPSPSPTASAPLATATPFVSSTPAEATPDTTEPVATRAPEEKPPPDKPQRQAVAPIGPVQADPVRVQTGDGDCLNIRQAPGTKFDADPRACVPEGFLLWLHGDPQVVDGETWRYALGEGWVATRYVRADPTAKTGMGTLRSVTVLTGDYVEIHAGRVDDRGQVTPLGDYEHVIQGMGGDFGQLSDSGRYVALTRYTPDYGVPTLVIIDLEDGGKPREFPGVSPSSWGPTDLLAVTESGPGCPAQCTWTPGWIDPAEGVVHRFADAASMSVGAWAADGKMVYAFTNDRRLLRIGLDGALTVVQQFAADDYLGELTVSPDGTRVLSGTTTGAIRVVDLNSSAVTSVARAPQREILGRCGSAGFYGKLSVWIDDNTVAWHEAWGEKGYNGITIARLGSSERRVIPYFNLGAMEMVAPGLLAFTTNEWIDGVAFPLTWLLDTATGEARPLTVGGDPSFAR